MKRLYKIPFLAVFLLFSGAISAQILSYDFEKLTVGDKVAETLGEPWTTWNNAPGGDEDAIASDEHTEGARSMKIDNGNDVVLKLGDKTTEAYKISFDMYIPEGKEGYFNVLHEFQQTSPNNFNKWAFQMYFKSESYGNYVMDGSYNTDIYRYPFDIPYDTWFNIEINVDIDGGYIIIKVNSNIICEIVQRFHHVYNNSLSAMNFYPSNHTDLTKNGFYVDNIAYDVWNETFVHNIVPEADNINRYYTKNVIDTVSYKLINEGNSVGHLTSWIDYGLGNDNGEEYIMHRDDAPRYVCGLSWNTYIEVGTLFDIGDFIDSLAMGRKIIGMQYYVPYYNGESQFEGPVTFRIYRGKYGEIIEEKIVAFEAINEGWNSVYFDKSIPINGQYPYLASVGFQQVENGLPISTDKGPYKKNANLYKENGYGWLTLDQYTSGNNNIRLICAGEPVNAQCVRQIDGLDDYFTPWQSKSYNLVFNTHGLEFGNYNFTLVVETNNVENPVINIPIVLKVCGEGVEENITNKYTIYPNPAKDIIHIDGDDLNCAVLYNSKGQMISIIGIVNNVINVKELDNGIYYLNIINTKGENSMSKIIVSR